MVGDKRWGSRFLRARWRARGSIGVFGLVLVGGHLWSLRVLFVMGGELLGLYL